MSHTGGTSTGREKAASTKRRRDGPGPEGAETDMAREVSTRSVSRRPREDVRAQRREGRSLAAREILRAVAVRGREERLLRRGEPLRAGLEHRVIRESGRYGGRRAALVVPGDRRAVRRREEVASVADRAGEAEETEERRGHVRERRRAVERRPAREERREEDEGDVMAEVLEAVRRRRAVVRRDGEAVIAADHEHRSPVPGPGPGEPEEVADRLVRVMDRLQHPAGVQPEELGEALDAHEAAARRLRRLEGRHGV